MQNPSSKDYYDVVVIGAGIGGLTAAALLSKSGLSVGVLEKEPHSGGYLAGFRRKDFIFDTAIHWLNQFGADGMITRVFDLLGKDHPQAIPQEKIRRYIGRNFNYLLTNQPDLFRDQLIADFPHEKAGLLKFFACSRKIGLSLKNFNKVFRSGETMGFYERIKNKIGLLQFALPFIPHYRNRGEAGLRKGLSKFFKDPALQAVFASELELIGCFIPIGWAYFGDFQNPPRGGSKVIPHWLVHVIKHYENPVFYNCAVNQILVENGRCTGVRYLDHAREKELRCKYVIAANDLETLYEKMLPAELIPASLKERLRSAQLYSSSVTISIALNCTAESLGFGEEMIHLVNENQLFGDHSCGEPERSELILLAPTVRDKSMANKDCGTLTIFMPAEMDFENNWKTTLDKDGNYIRGEAYKQLKNAIAERIIDRVERELAPGLRNHIIFFEVATPVTHYRYTGNKNGTMMGARPGEENYKKKIAHYRTSVKNLIIGGHWAELGGGVPIAVKAGTNAALLVLIKENKNAFAALTAYMDGKAGLDYTLAQPCFRSYDNSWKQPLTPAEKQQEATALKV